MFACSLTTYNVMSGVNTVHHPKVISQHIIYFNNPHCQHYASMH